jgi:hypothetical protein
VCRREKHPRPLLALSQHFTLTSKTKFRTIRGVFGAIGGAPPRAASISSSWDHR